MLSFTCTRLAARALRTSRRQRRLLEDAGLLCGRARRWRKPKPSAARAGSRRRATRRACGRRRWPRRAAAEACCSRSQLAAGLSGAARGSARRSSTADWAARAPLWRPPAAHHQVRLAVLRVCCAWRVQVHLIQFAPCSLNMHSIGNHSYVFGLCD